MSKIPEQIDHQRYWTAPKGKEKETMKEFLNNGQGFLTEKKDGHAYVLIRDKDGDFFLTSRTVGKNTGLFAEKSENVPHIIQAFKDENIPNDSIIIGEIFYPGRTAPAVTTIMGCLPGKAQLRNKEDPISFYAFDLLRWDGEDYMNKGALERIQKLNEIWSQYDFFRYVYLDVAYPILENQEEALVEIKAAGGEGCVWKRSDGKYVPGARTARQTLKLKQCDTVDLVIMGSTLATREYKGEYPDDWEYRENGEPVTKGYFYGWHTSLILGAYDENGELVRVCDCSSGLTDEDRAALGADPESFIGSVVEINCMEKIIKDRTIRHPRIVKFRFEDKAAEDCKLDEIFR
jgi:ATP-dependent DNA ligase